MDPLLLIPAVGAVGALGRRVWTWSRTYVVRTAGRFDHRGRATFVAVEVRRRVHFSEMPVRVAAIILSDASADEELVGAKVEAAAKARLLNQIEGR